ncbi:hypothetical protein EVAR_4030_1 [Eumeta japonica]|uniref:Uncharacterized protein n=1 Tax=Eumeta variegata TaxID=151549 RepID=A0A4C1T3R2_EUMVA|nr:hypothetical protein EVAR_4030_1 [Eumeta japonica]
MRLELAKLLKLANPSHIKMSHVRQRRFADVRASSWPGTGAINPTDRYASPPGVRAARGRAAHVPYRAAARSLGGNRARARAAPPTRVKAR